jgi:release factor glutamine methyltransferase
MGVVDKQFSVAGNVAEAFAIASLRDEAALQGLPRLDAELLLVRATGRSRTHLGAFDEQPLSAAQMQVFRALVQRRLSGEPLAYIDGRKEFWSLELLVTPDVLVPRPETELLVERCLALLTGPHSRIADLGTGSGAIALALAHERPSWTVVATDASAKALAVAGHNAQRLGLEHIDFRLGDWCQALADDRFDAIVSNPPYIAPDDAALVALTQEPAGALVAQSGGLADLLDIIEAAPAHLNSGGHLLLEHGCTQGPDVAGALVARGYARVVCRPDLAGLDRVTEAVWP